MVCEGGSSWSDKPRKTKDCRQPLEEGMNDSSIYSLEIPCAYGCLDFRLLASRPVKE